MLAHEFGLLRERLDAARGDTTRFFAFADTAAARSFSGGTDCHAWTGIRFQHAFRAEPSDLLIHVRLLDATNPLQQEAVGRLGVNLTHAALKLWKQPTTMVDALLDEIGPARIEIDWISARGPAFAESDLRTYSSDEVRDRICSGDPTWKDLVAPEVAALIGARGYFGGRCDLPPP